MTDSVPMANSVGQFSKGRDDSLSWKRGHNQSCVFGVNFSRNLFFEHRFVQSTLEQHKRESSSLLQTVRILWVSLLQAAGLEALEECCKRTETSHLVLQGVPKSFISFLGLQKLGKSCTAHSDPALL